MKLLGVDLGGTFLRSALIELDAAGHVSLQNQRQQLRPETAPAMVAAIAQLAAEAGGPDIGGPAASGPDIGGPDIGGPDIGGLAAVGVGCACFMHHQGVLVHSPNIPALVGFEFKDELQSQLSCPVTLENDAAAAAWAEAQLGAGREVANMAFVAFGTGVGGALVLNGRLQRGIHGLGAEPGHITVDPHGPPCACGRRGCWELFASGTALGHYARDLVRDDDSDSSAMLDLAAGQIEAIDGSHIASAVASGDRLAQAALAQLCDWIAVGLNTVIVMTDPEMVVLGGGLSDLGQPFLQAVRHSYQQRYHGHDARPQLRLELATLGEYAGAVGAALLTQDSL